MEWWLTHKRSRKTLLERTIQKKSRKFITIAKLKLTKNYKIWQIDESNKNYQINR